jgi:hypothetical protein
MVFNSFDTRYFKLDGTSALTGDTWDVTGDELLYINKASGMLGFGMQPTNKFDFNTDNDGVLALWDGGADLGVHISALESGVAGRLNLVSDQLFLRNTNTLITDGSAEDPISANAMLDVIGSNTTLARFNHSSNGSLKMIGSDGLLALQSVDTGDSGTTLMLNPNGGYVSIGYVPAPDEMLDVNGNAQVRNSGGGRFLIRSTGDATKAGLEFYNRDADSYPLIIHEDGYIRTNVSVGIGSGIEPTHLLCVGDGTNNESVVQVDSLGTAWAGYSIAKEGVAKWYVGMGGFGAYGDKLIFRYDNADKMTLDNGSLGIGTVAPDSKLHIMNESAGTIAPIAHTVVTIENNDDNYISFLNPAGVKAGLIFGDADDNDKAQLYYDHDDDRFWMIGDFTQDAANKFTVFKFDIQSSMQFEDGAYTRLYLATGAGAGASIGRAGFDCPSVTDACLQVHDILRVRNSGNTGTVLETGDTTTKIFNALNVGPAGTEYLTVDSSNSIFDTDIVLNAQNLIYLYGNGQDWRVSHNYTDAVLAFDYQLAAGGYTEKAGVTPDGGFFTTYTAGENLATGEVVYIRQAGGTNGRVWKNPIDGDMPVGVVYLGVSSGALVRVVFGGHVKVLPTSGLSLTRGYVIYSSASEAGRVDNAASAPAATTHFRECGHPDADSAGNGQLTMCTVHFN